MSALKHHPEAPMSDQPWSKSSSSGASSNRWLPRRARSFSAGYGVTVRRADESEDPVSPEFFLCSIIGFTGRDVRGTLVLALTEELSGLSNPVAGANSSATTDRLIQRDWVGELSNQLLGQIKIELLRRGVEIYVTCRRCCRVSTWRRSRAASSSRSSSRSPTARRRCGSSSRRARDSRSKLPAARGRGPRPRRHAAIRLKRAARAGSAPARPAIRPMRPPGAVRPASSRRPPATRA